MSLPLDRIPCIVGIGTTPFGELHRTPDPERSAYELAADAFFSALHDAGLRKADIDGVVVGRLPSYLKFCADVGLVDTGYVNFQAGGGFQSGLALADAAMLVQSGIAEVVACVYGNNGRSVQHSYGGLATPTSRYEDPYGMSSNGAYYGLLFRRHQHEFGTPIEALADLAVAIRSNALLNPQAVMRTPITRDDYFKAPLVVDPLRRLDYCMVNDGGVAYLVTSLARARELKQTPVRIRSSAVSGAMSYFYGTEDFWHATLASMRNRLFGGQDFSAADIDVAQIYDNFTPAIVFALEGLGICKRGEAGPWILEGHHRRDGKMPINTSGGHLSEAYMQGWALTVEAVRQLRGQAGDRQIADCQVVLDTSCTPICSAHILTR